MSILGRFKGQGGIEKLLSILEESDDKARETMLSQMRGEDPSFTRDVEARILYWKDVFQFEAKVLEEIVKTVPTKTLLTAMVGLEPHFIEMINKAADRRTQIKMHDEAEGLGSPSPAMVSTSRRKIIQTARQLERSGLVKLDKKAS